MSTDIVLVGRVRANSTIRPNQIVNLPVTWKNNVAIQIGIVNDVRMDKNGKLYAKVTIETCDSLYYKTVRDKIALEKIPYGFVLECVRYLDAKGNEVSVEPNNVGIFIKN